MRSATPTCCWMAVSPGCQVESFVIVVPSLMVLSHVAMIGGMVALMLYRFDRYAHAAHGRRA